MVATDIEMSGLPPDEPIELQADYKGKTGQVDNADVFIQHLRHLIQMVESRRIEQGSLEMTFIQGTQKIKVERLPDECDIKYYPTEEFTIFVHFRFED